jgi:superfamily II DNA or RNA helicase
MKLKVTPDAQWLIIQEVGSSIEYKHLELWLTRYIDKYQFHPKVKARVWDGRTSYFNKGKIRIGLWKEVKLCCENYGYDFIIENMPEFPLNRDVSLDSMREFCIDFFKHHKNKTGGPFFPHDHQIEESYKTLRSRYCTTEVATSGGKTLMMSLMIFYTLRRLAPDAKFLIVVPSITLVVQTYNELHNYNLGFNCENPNPLDLRITEIMSDTPRVYSGDIGVNIYIGTFQSLDKYDKKFFEQFHTVLIDESHKTKAVTIQDILKNCSLAYNRIGLSGTYYKPDSLESLTVQSLLGPGVGQVRAENLISKGLVAPVDIRVLLINHNNQDMYNLSKDMRSSGKGKECFELEEEFVRASTQRMDFIIGLMKKVTKNSLVLFKSIDYGKALYEKCCEIEGKEFFYIDGQIKKKERELIKAQLEQPCDVPRILIASYGTLSTGVSINQLMNLFFVESYKSEVTIRQSIGRVLRLHEDKICANVFDLVDLFMDYDEYKSYNILYKHYMERKNIYIEQNFPYKEMKLSL